MRKLLFAGIVLVVSALAGCSDDGETADSTDDDCPVETHFTDSAGECVAHVEPSIQTEGLNGTLQQYSPLTFTWSLDPGTRGADNNTVHSMDSRILATPTDDAIGNDTSPDDYGTEIDKQQHKNFPDSFEATFSWDETGTVYLKGYMLISGQDVWQDIATIEVVSVTASGNVETVTITGPEAGGAPAADSSEVGLKVGDGLVIANDNAFDYEASFDCKGLSIDPVTVPAGDSTGTTTFLEPTNCSVTLNTPLSASGSDPGEIGFKVNVSTP